AGDSRRGEPLAAFTIAPGGPAVAISQGGDGEVHVPFSFAEAFENYVSERWRAASDSPRLSGRQLDLFYAVKRAIPRSWQLTGRRMLIKRQGVPEFPAWPLDAGMVSLLIC